MISSSAILLIAFASFGQSVSVQRPFPPPKPVTVCEAGSRYGYEEYLSATKTAREEKELWFRSDKLPPSPSLHQGLYEQDVYFGIRTFARTYPEKCLVDSSITFDVAFLGAPFDTTTSYRPGARFGPGGIRQGSQRIGGFNRLLQVNPFIELKIVDCGDVRMSLFDNTQALQSLEEAYTEIVMGREVFNQTGDSIALDGKHHPRIIALGGDHTITLPILRSLHQAYGKISVIHFDSHLDTAHPIGLPITHGSYFWFAYQEGLLTNTSIHAGIRSPMGPQKDDTDHSVGFISIIADEIEDIGTSGVIERIIERVGDGPVYLSLDIDVLDPAFAPATGTPEIGGWTTREIKRILHGLKDLNIVGADVVEVAPAYDDQAEITQIAAANIAYEMLSMFALKRLVK
ncbi:Arginase/deacetylase [Atractiella rhizophila]|nr:Arginase/deacetylase [Atractiella rhizophila]